MYCTEDGMACFLFSSFWLSSYSNSSCLLGANHLDDWHPTDNSNIRQWNGLLTYFLLGLANVFFGVLIVFPSQRSLSCHTWLILQSLWWDFTWLFTVYDHTQFLFSYTATLFLFKFKSHQVFHFFFKSSKVTKCQYSTSLWHCSRIFYEFFQLNCVLVGFWREGGRARSRVPSVGFLAVVLAQWKVTGLLTGSVSWVGFWREGGRARSRVPSVGFLAVVLAQWKVKSSDQGQTIWFFEFEYSIQITSDVVGSLRVPSLVPALLWPPYPSTTVYLHQYKRCVHALELHVRLFITPCSLTI